ncbi:Aminoacylase-1 [Schistosoma japonicum]|uniref:N-acyl-aliphatic-L-amino acid amidohydrolase n=1 Tax=Schistosoma japonicum TaxID=6182 RepID=A0A4Z2CPE7_SCHJA|nr:Aminoacylase-1 [Schistosoma japonicum]
MLKGFLFSINQTHYAVELSGNYPILLFLMHIHLSLFQNNDIDVDFEKIQKLQNNLGTSGIQSKSESAAKSFKIGKLRRLLKKETKYGWLEASICRAFWSHLFLGSNEIIRCLESSVCSKSGSNNEAQEKRISFVFVDFGWLASHYGHHLTNLCKLLNIRLVAIKPTGSLPELVTTKLRPIKKLVVFGFCLSNETPSDLSDICKQIEIRFPVLVNDASNISAVMSIKKQHTSHEMFTNHPEVPSSVNKKESWEDVKIDPKLYDYSSPAHKFTVAEFQPFLFSLGLRSFGNEIFHGVLENVSHSESENRCSFCAYKSPVLKAVVARIGRKHLKRKIFIMNDIDEKLLDEIAIKNFIKYLQFTTVHPNPCYRPAVEWLVKLGQELELVCNIVELIPSNPIVIMRWEGYQPELPAIMLNSHMDVVPVVEKKWSYPPFSGVITPDGKIYGRGTQDMKSVGIQQLEAVRRLKSRGCRQLRRTVYITFVPDEELGGVKGMKPFVANYNKSISHFEEISFPDMNIGFCLDEGIPSCSEDYIAFYDERRPVWLNVNFYGNAGHGLALIENTAAEKFRIFFNHVYSFRIEEQLRLENSQGKLTLGDITTVNMTMVNGGVQHNVVPEKLSASFDIRLTPSLSLDDFKNKLDQWRSNAGAQIEFEFINTGVDLKQSVVIPNESTNPWWATLVNVCSKYGSKVQKRIFPGATDARFIREYHLLPHVINRKPILAIGFSPIKNTPVLLHDHDEYLDKNEFLCGCRLYSDLVQALGELP